MLRLTVQLVVFALIIAGIQMFLGSSQVPEEILELDRGLSAGKDIVFLGDSSNFVSALEDTDKRSISEMLQDLAPDREVLSIDHPAYHTSVFLAYCNLITNADKEISHVIMPLNMRSFSPNWDPRPEFQFGKERFFLANSGRRALTWPFFKPLSVFKAVDLAPIAESEFNRVPVFCDEEQVGTVMEFRNPDQENVTPEEIRRQLVFKYMYPLSPDHRKVRSMLDIPRLLASKGIGCIFYITPVDHETGERYLPGKFRKRLACNVELLKDLLREEKALVLDLSQSVPTDHFSWKRHKYPNEHLGQEGRRFVAERLSRVLSGRIKLSNL